MKRIIARFGANGEGCDKESPNTAAYSAYIGRQLAVGKHSVSIDDIIAEGGYGVVFKVKSAAYKYFALKRLCVNSEEDLTRCKQEMSFLRMFRHKNIIGLVDTAVSRSQSGVYEVFMLLQYCRGTVRDLVNKAIANRMDLNEGTVMKIFCDMCEAVGCLHEQNVIHRDLKIENILIDDSGNYLLCDFGSATSEPLVPRTHGIARTEEEISKYTTLAYRAPEMLDLYKNSPIGSKADVWALGCLLYALCFLKLPFKDSSLAIQAGEFSLPGDSIYSQNLRKLIGYILRPDPKERPDIYQVSVLAFQIHGHSHSPLRNSQNSPLPSFVELSLPRSDSDVMVKTHSPVLNAAAVAEPVKTSVAPRQRPRGAGVPLMVSSPVPSSGSPPTPSSLPPPPSGDSLARSRALKEPSMSNSTEASSSSASIQTSPLLLDIGGGGSVLSPACSALERVEDTSPDLLSFDSPTSAVAPLPGSAPAFRNFRPLGHRRLLSDTSAVPGLTPFLRPPAPSPRPLNWAALRPPQPLKASLSMDFIGAGAPGLSHSYQAPPRLGAGPNVPAGAQPTSRSISDEPRSNPQSNPHHQWQQPLRGNRQLSSSSADLINLSASGSCRPMGLMMRHYNFPPAANAGQPDCLRAASALELDAFGSVPFSSTPDLNSSLSASSCEAIPPRTHPVPGHSRSASHGQYFRRA